MLNIAEIALPAVILCICIIVLIKSAKQVENNLINVSRKTHFKEFFVGFVILGLLTNLPEAVIVLMSADTAPELSVGNLFGGALILSTLILGLITLKFGTIKFRYKFEERDLLIGLAQIFFSIVVISDGYVSVVESVLLLVTYLVYIRSVNHKFQFYSRKTLSNFDIRIFLKKGNLKLLVSTTVSILLLVLSAHFIVQVSEQITTSLSIPLAFFGLFVLGIGTNIPEIAILLTANKEQNEEKDLTVGSVLGSIFIRSGLLGLLGIVSGGFIIHDMVILIPTIVILLISTILFGVFSWSNKNLTKFEGTLLISAYIALIISEILVLSNLL